MKSVVVVGGGPAGLMAAEVLAQGGVAVQVYDAMPSVGRKFLLAGKGGLNLTHAEPGGIFQSRYGARHPEMTRLLQDFGAEALRVWAQGLGIDTFVGTSGRVFPKDMKAAPLLRAWLHRLRHPDTGVAVQFHMRHRWLGWMPDGQTLRFASPAGEVAVACDALVLALGGASWARLGSDGAWVPVLQGRGVDIAPLLPANCGFDVAMPTVASPAQPDHAAGTAGMPSHAGWSPYFAERFAGQPFKSVAITFTDASGHRFECKGEFVATATGVEGSLIYAASSMLRDAIAQQGHADFTLDLRPDLSPERVLAEVLHPRGSRSLSSHLKSRLGLEGIKMALLHEVLPKAQLQNPPLLAQTIKAVPVRVVAARPLDEAISTAGGVRFEALTPQLMLQQQPGVFCAGEMLDWEAPTGGYLLTACFASGRQAGLGALAHVLQNG